MKKVFLVFGLLASLVISYAQEKVKLPVVQSVGVSILPFGVVTSDYVGDGDVYSKGELLVFYERGSRFRFHAEGGLSMLSLLESESASTLLSPSASVAVGYRMGERSDMRAYFSGNLGLGAQLIPQHGLAQKLFFDFQYSYYFTNRLGFNALVRFGNYNMSNLYFLLVGAGVMYTL